MTDNHNSQVCTGVMMHGYPLVKKLCAELQDFMREHNFSSIEEFRGYATISHIMIIVFDIVFKTNWRNYFLVYILCVTHTFQISTLCPILPIITKACNKLLSVNHQHESAGPSVVKLNAQDYWLCVFCFLCNLLRLHDVTKWKVSSLTKTPLKS
jgi:hypothetical protein